MAHYQIIDFMKRPLILLLTTLTLIPVLRGADHGKKTPAATAEQSAELPRVSAADIEAVKQLIGKRAIVFGKVTSSNEVEKSGITFLDLDGAKFTVVCWKDNYSKFEGGRSPAKLYKGKDIEVTGEIFEYKGKTGKGSPQPEIKLTDPAQVKVTTMEKKAGTKEQAAPKASEKTEDPKRVNPKKYFK